ncbi:MAG: hypothetical protein QOK36_110, partial [Gaiellales bacterium]|nr:hypothetical protein [Gaiellales bacterium]
LIELCRAARAAIVGGRFRAFADEALERLGSGTAQKAHGQAQGAQ